MNAIYTQDYRNKKIWAVLKEYSAKKYGRKREFVDAEISARLWISLDEDMLTPTENNVSETTVSAQDGIVSWDWATIDSEVTTNDKSSDT